MATATASPSPHACAKAEWQRAAVWRLVAIALLAPCMTAQATGKPRTAPTLCAADEQTLFSCQLQTQKQKQTQSTGKQKKAQGKLVSVCSALDLASAKTFLTYRMGRPGQLELVYPATRAGSLQAFSRWHYGRYQTDYFELYFSQGGYDYTIYSHYADGKHRHGVSVARPGNDEPLTELACATPVTQDLHKLDDYVACQPDRAGMDCPAP